jgi:hypothetical protein
MLQVWLHGNVKACKLPQTIDDMVFINMLSCETSTQICQKLILLYEQKFIEDIHHLHQEFFESKMSKVQNIVDFLCKIESITCQWHIYIKLLMIMLSWPRSFVTYLLNMTIWWLLGTMCQRINESLTIWHYNFWRKKQRSKGAKNKIIPPMQKHL